MSALLLERFGEVLAAGVAAAVAFVAVTYGLAITLTRGRFGWPGFRYFFRETFLVVVTQSMLPLGWLIRSRAVAQYRSSSGASASDGTRPIIFVHGYTQNRTNFLWLARYLARKGVGPFFGFDYNTLRPIEKSAQNLSGFVASVLAATGATEVDLVCHSLGGVVARTYVDLLGGEQFVHRIVTLGSPHRGLRHAKLGFGAALSQLYPPNGFIARLDDADLSPRVVYLSIYSAHDNIVFPGVASSLGARGTDVVVHEHGHFGILFSEEVAAHVHRALTSADQRRGLNTAGTPTASESSGTSETTTALAPTST